MSPDHEARQDRATIGSPRDSLQLPNVLDIRTVGLTAAIDLASMPDAFGKRAYTAMHRGFEDYGFMVRNTGETLALTPPLVISEAQIDETVDKLGKLIRAVA